MTNMLPIKAMDARTEYVARVKEVIPTAGSGKTCETYRNELVLFMFVSVCRSKTLVFIIC